MHDNHCPPHATRTRRPLITAWFALLLALTISAPVWGIEVNASQWGFDGKVVAGRFNPVSILFVDTNGAGFNGVVELHRSDGINGRVGAPLVQQVYVSQQASRWVQFFPFIGTEQEQWVLTWGPGDKDRMELPLPRRGLGARVILDEPDAVTLSNSGLHHFSDALFPTSGVELDTLHSLVLDYAPKWEPVKRKALLDWLARGGTLHLLHNAHGEFPSFGDDLATLNSPLEKLHFGNGMIVHHAISRRDASETFLAKQGYPAPELTDNQPYNMWYSFESAAFQRLKEMTRPRHNWILIYGLILVYLGIVGPGGLIVGKWVRDYRASIAMVLVAVPLFGAAFFYIGRRGYGEVATARTLAYAEPGRAGNDNSSDYDTTEWTNVFVTDSGDYRLTHKSPHSLYATAASMEAVNGAIENGKDGSFTVEMPLYSSQTFIHRGTMRGDVLKPHVNLWPADGATPPTIDLQPDPARHITHAWCQYNNQVYVMNIQGNQLQPGGVVQPLGPDTFDGNPWSQWNGPFSQQDDGSPAAEENRWGQMELAVVSRAVGSFEKQTGMVTARGGLVVHSYGTKTPSPPPAPLNPGQFDLFIACPLPNGFQVEGAARQESGRVVYHFVLRKGDE